MVAQAIFFTVSLILWWSGIYSASFNVVDFGAIGDGVSDDSQAFIKAWESACGDSTASEVIIPKDKNFLLKPVKFQGPCKSVNISFHILGDIVASTDFAAFKGHLDNWLQFLNIEGLTVDGGDTGKIDGKGHVWWGKCVKDRRQCPQRPTTVTFNRCNNLKLQRLKFVDSPGNFISLAGCVGVDVNNIDLNAPANSPNTDGIDVIGSSNVFIYDSKIGVGDDCVAINNNAHDINITRLTCGPGHGISIGSLGGSSGGSDIVQEVHVSNSSLIGTTSGVKIKTWQGGNGAARRITFENINVTNASYPIFIDQYYCLNKDCVLNETSAIHISDITYKHIIGTSAIEDAIVFNCSQSVACANIQIDQVNITSIMPGKKTNAQCINAHFKEVSSSIPPLNSCF